MSFRIAPDLWDQLCRLLATYPTCSVMLNQYQGQVCSLDLHLHVKGKQEPVVISVPQNGPVSGLPKTKVS
jgi:hypothetical protein